MRPHFRHLSFARVLGASCLAFLGAAGPAQGVTLSLVDPHGAVSRFDWSIDGHVIRVESTWSGRSAAFVQMSGLTARTAYTVQHAMVNGTATTWHRVANELLDPAGQEEDRVLDLPDLPRWVPAGWSLSNGNDGLSFAKGLNLPRTSSVFGTAAWEPVVGPFIDKRDYIDFSGGRLAAGGIDDFQTFGLRDNCAVCGNQPFLWAIRPGAASVAVVPEPGTLALWAAGLAGLAWAGRRRRQGPR